MKWIDGKMFCDCGEEAYYMKTRNGKWIPVNASSMTEMELDDCRNHNTRLFDPEKHISHFTTCPNAKGYRK